jgi:hypothetical protein
MTMKMMNNKINKPHHNYQLNSTNYSGRWKLIISHLVNDISMWNCLKALKATINVICTEMINTVMCISAPADSQKLPYASVSVEYAKALRRKRAFSLTV